MFWQLIGQYALVAYFGVLIALFWLVESRTSSGMNLRRYRAIWDRHTSDTGQFLLCGMPIHPGQSRARTIRSATAPNERPVSDDVDIHGRWVDPLDGAFEG